MTDNMTGPPTGHISGIEELNLGDGALIFTEGEKGQVAYMILSGAVEIFREADGEQVVLATLSEGSLFGEMALIEGAPRSASARAKGDSRLRVLDRQALIQSMGDNPDVSLALMNRLSGYVRSANERIVTGNTFGASSDDRPDLAMQSKRSLLDTLLPWRNRTETLIASFQPDAVEIENRPVPALSRLGAWAILMFMTVMLLWASFGRIETVVSGRGVLGPAVANISIQATEAGIIQTLHVSEGDVVAKGDRLVTLDATNIQSDIAAVRAQLTAAEARQNRLNAEFSSRMLINEPYKFSNDTQESHLQQEIFRSRLAEYRSKVDSFNKQLIHLNVRLDSVAKDRALAQKQLGLLRQLESAKQTLYNRKVGSKVQYLSSVNQRLSLERELTGMENGRVELLSRMNSLRSERRAFFSQWFSKVTEDLVREREEVKRLTEELSTLDRRAANLSVRASGAAIVLNTNTLATGSVLRQAQEIMVLVPVDVPMLLRLDIPAKDISQVKTGDQVSIKLDALPFQKHRDLLGRIDFISEDTFAETLSGEPGPVYRARVQIEKDRLVDKPGDFRFLPGMSAGGDILVGDRLIISYFLAPVMRWLGSGLREP